MNKYALLYIIILTYNGCADTIACIESVRKTHYPNYRIVIIDNASADNTVSELQSRYKNAIDIIRMPENLGYAGGNNVGIEYAIAQGAEYICLLNNDILMQPQTLPLLICGLSEYTAGIVGPVNLFWNKDIIYSSGLYINFYKGTAIACNHGRKIDEIDMTPVFCDYLEGTCLLFHSSLIQKAGKIPEHYFLYFEDTEWCCQIKKCGLPVLCIPQSRIWHKGSASVNKITGLKKYYEDRNRILFERRNAPFFSKVIFYVYFMLQFIYRIITRQRNYKDCKAILDAFQPDSVIYKTRYPQ